MNVEDLRAAFGGEILALQAAAHRCPEQSGGEIETSALLRGAFAPLGLQEIPLGLRSGCAFLLRTGRSGPITGLRADIDGLPVDEPTEAENRSAHPGMMHACGHDTHMAALFGAALALSSARDKLTGDVLFLFQPSEETACGARAVLRTGLLNRVPVSALFGLHNMPELPVGTVGLRQGALLSAKDAFELTVSGSGGHGAAPERCSDPIVAAAAVVTALQTVVSRNVSPLCAAVLSVCSIHGGASDNRIEDEVVLRGSVRTLQAETRVRVLERMEQLSSGCAAAYGCTATLHFTQSVPAVVNAPALAETAALAARASVPKAQIAEAEPQMISEDFACYGAVVPSWFYLLGSGTPGRENAPLHSARYRAHPDTALYGAALLANAALARTQK